VACELAERYEKPMPGLPHFPGVVIDALAFNKSPPGYVGSGCSIRPGLVPTTSLAEHAANADEFGPAAVPERCAVHADGPGNRGPATVTQSPGAVFKQHVTGSACVARVLEVVETPCGVIALPWCYSGATRRPLKAATGAASLAYRTRP